MAFPNQFRELEFYIFDRCCFLLLIVKENIWLPDAVLKFSVPASSMKNMDISLRNPDFFSYFPFFFFSLSKFEVEQSKLKDNKCI